MPTLKATPDDGGNQLEMGGMRRFRTNLDREVLEPGRAMGHPAEARN